MSIKKKFLDVIADKEGMAKWVYGSSAEYCCNKACLIENQSFKLSVVKDDGEIAEEVVDPGTFVELIGLSHETDDDPCVDSLWRIMDKEEVDFDQFIKDRFEKYTIGHANKEPQSEDIRILDTYEVTSSFSVCNFDGSTSKVIAGNYIIYCGNHQWIVVYTNLPKIIYVMGQSNTGKDTMRDCFSELIKNHFCNFDKKYHMIVSHTNRPIREKEIDGKTYVFHMPVGREFLSQEFENPHNDVITLSTFKVANGDYWDYWDCYSDLRRDKINIMIGDNVKCSQLIKQVDAGRLHMKVIKLTCPDVVLLARATKRSLSEPLKNDEMIRRLTADMEAYSEENLKSLGITEYESVDTSGPDAFKNFLLAIDKLSK